MKNSHPQAAPPCWGVFRCCFATAIRSLAATKPKPAAAPDLNRCPCLAPPLSHAPVAATPPSLRSRPASGSAVRERLTGWVQFSIPTGRPVDSLAAATSASSGIPTGTICPPAVGLDLRLLSLIPSHAPHPRPLRAQLLCQSTACPAGTHSNTAPLWCGSADIKAGLPTPAKGCSGDAETPQSCLNLLYSLAKLLC